MNIIGTKVGKRSSGEIEQLIRETGYDLTFDTKDTGLYVEVTWIDGHVSVLVWCHNREEYSRWYDSVQLLREAQPWELSRFSIVERSRCEDDEESIT